MNVLTSHVSLLLHYLYSVIISVNAQEVAEDIICVQRSGCSCVFPNGTGIDLLKSARRSAITSFKTYEEREFPGAGVVLSSYYFHPCFDVTFSASMKSTDCNTCKENFSICRRVILTTRDPGAPNVLTTEDIHYDFLGSSDNTEFAPDGSYIKYLNTPSYTIVYLVCADIADALYPKDLSHPSRIKLQFLSRNACMKQIYKKCKLPASKCKAKCKFRRLNSSEILIQTIP